MLMSSLMLVLLARRSSSFASSVPFATRQHFARGGASSSSSIRSSSSVGKNEAVIEEDCMSIVGNNIFPATFGGVSYYNTALLPEFRVVFVLGGPGAGKGTQCELLLNEGKYPCVHLSVGDLLRAEQTRDDSPHRKLIQDCLVAGQIVPVEISLALLQRAMEEASLRQGRSLLYLVDGFPRNYDNLEGWNRCMKGVAAVWGVLMFTCPLPVLEQRILERAKTSGRSDDNLKSAHKRFRTFQQETVPVVNTLRRVQEKMQMTQQEQNGSMPLQVQDMNGDSSIKEVWGNVQQTMNQYLANDIWTANAKLVEAIETQNVDLYRHLCPYMNGDSTDMVAHEGCYAGTKMTISNASIQFITGRQAITSYDRGMDDNDGDGRQIMVREERVWSHEGIQGWVNVHFTRTPL